ncbi:MAG: hypothetical protein WKF86_00225 [Acidimicrobiales bacterium]
MAEGSIGLPADGSGKKLRTLTGGAAQPTRFTPSGTTNVLEQDLAIICPR